MTGVAIMIGLSPLTVSAQLADTFEIGPPNQEAKIIGSYNLSSVYRDSVLLDEFESSPYPFYMDNINYPTLRKMAHLSCVHYKDGVYGIKIQMSEQKMSHDSVITKLNNQHVFWKFLDRTFSKDTHRMFKSFQYSSECQSWLRELYGKALKEFQIINFYSDDQFSIHASKTQLPNSMLQFNKLMFDIRASNNSFENHRPLFHGRKTPVAFVFIPGLTMSSLTFDEASQNLFSLGYNVMSISYTCQKYRFDSESQCLEPPSVWEDNILQIVAKLKAIGFGDKIVLVGHSIGGSISIRISKRTRVDGLILLQPAFSLTNLAHLAVKNLNLLNFLFKDKTVFEYQKEVFNLGTKYILSKPNLHKEKIDIPTLMFVADKDFVVGSDTQMQFAQYNSTHVTVVKHNRQSKYTGTTMPINRHMFYAFEDENMFYDIYHFVRTNIEK